MLIDIIRAAAIGKINEANAASVIAGLEARGQALGLDRPHRLAQYLAQLMHESLDFRHDREIWGPTEAQKRYDTRADLGNTPALDGDGRLYMGRSGIQLTGKANYRAFRDWCREQGLDAPDFVAQPELINTDPWEGLVPLWYWAAGNPDRQSLNRYADGGNAEMITRRINGGLNGYGDRLDRLARVSLVLLGFGPTAVKAFQLSAGLVADGDVGAKTRAAMHAALVKRPALVLGPPAASAPPVAALARVMVTPLSLPPPPAQPPAAGGLWAGLAQLVAAILGRKPA